MVSFLCKINIIFNFNHPEVDVQGGIIPYKNWKNQTLYKIIGWPLNVEFKDYTNLNSKERLEVLNSLNNIRFEFQ